MTTTQNEARPWWRQTSTLIVLGLLVLAAGVGVGLILSSGDDGGDELSTTGTVATTTEATAPPTTAAPSTTAVRPDSEAARQDCVAGDQEACDTLPDRVLEELCDGGRGSLDACQVLLAHQGDGVPDGDELEGGG